MLYPFNLRISATVAAWFGRIPLFPEALVASSVIAAPRAAPWTANLTQITVQDLYAPGEYGTNAQPNTLQIRPLLAVRPQLFTPLEQLIRPTFEVVTVPRGKGASTATALGDMQLLDLFVMPWPNSEKTRFRWGIGPYFVFPTSTTQFGGQGAWQIWPAAAFSLIRAN